MTCLSQSINQSINQSIGHDWCGVLVTPLKEAHLVHGCAMLGELPSTGTHLGHLSLGCADNRTNKKWKGLIAVPR